jgi:hypothetical protein
LALPVLLVLHLLEQVLQQRQEHVASVQIRLPHPGGVSVVSSTVSLVLVPEQGQTAE